MRQIDSGFERLSVSWMEISAMLLLRWPILINSVSLGDRKAMRHGFT
jgi:hypothetical protein